MMHANLLVFMVTLAIADCIVIVACAALMALFRPVIMAMGG